MTPQEIADDFADLELSLIRSIKEALTAGKNDRAGWKLRRLRDIREFRRRNRAIMDRYAPQIEQNVTQMLKESYTDGAMETAAQHQTVNPSYRLEGLFDGVDDRRMDALTEEINSSLRTAETATLRMTDDIYRRIVYKAEIAQATGTVTMEQAVDQAARDFLERGITCVEYADGRRVNIVTYAEMALRTASTRSKLRGDAAQRKKLGVDTVLVSQYGACSDTCLPWQGRVYVDDVWGDPADMGADGLVSSQNGHRYMPLSAAVEAGLFHPNCRHSLSTWYEGISKLPKPMDAASVRRTAALEQRQRELERKVRKYKRLEAGTLDEDNIRKYRSKRMAAQKELRTFISANDDVLRRDYWREKTYGMVQPKQQTDQASVPDIRRDSSGVESQAAFDIDTARQEYKKFLQTVPEKNRIYLEYFSETAEFRKNTTMAPAYAYSYKYDVVYYNETSSAFSSYGFNRSVTHELAHRTDALMIHSEENSDFQAAIASSAEKLKKISVKAILSEVDSSEDGAMNLQDVISALYGGYHPDLDYGHSDKYYARPAAKEREIFANLFSMEAFGCQDLLDIIKVHFPELYAAYTKLL